MYLSYYTLYPRLSAVEMGPCHPSELWLGKFVMRYFEPYTVYTFINVYIYNYLLGKKQQTMHFSGSRLIIVWLFKVPVA